MSVATITTQDVTTDQTPDLLRALYSGTGPVPDKERTALLSVLSQSPIGKRGDALVTESDAAVQSAREALVAARTQSTQVRAQVGEARVTMARVALALTTKDVRGVASMTGAEFASALDVSPAYVSQVVSVARAMRRLGTTSPTAYSSLWAQRKISAQALADTVTAALNTATKRTTDAHPGDGKSDAGKSVPVRATVSEITAARETVSGTPSTPPVNAPKSVALRSTLDRAHSAIVAQGLAGSEDDRTRLLAILATLTDAVRTATLV